MDGHKIFKTAAIPIVLLIIGLKHYIQNLVISITVGIGRSEERRVGKECRL